MNTRKYRSLLAALVLIAVLVVVSACAAPAAAPAGGTSADAAPASGGQVALELTVWGSPAEKEGWEAQAAQHETQTDGAVAVNVQHIPADYDAKLMTMIAAGEEPDVAMMESASIAFPLAEEQRFINLKPLLDSDPALSSDNLVPNIQYSLDPDTVIGIGPGPETFVLYYNEEMLADAGVEAPPADAASAWTWDEFVDAAKTLTIDENGRNAHDPDFDPTRIRQFGITFGTWWGVYSNLIYSNGGDWLSPDGTTFALNQPEATEAIQALADLINVHHVAPNAAQSESIPALNVAMQTGRVAMAIDGQWASQDLAVAGIPFNVGVIPVMKEPVTTIVAGMLSIFESTDNPTESWELVKALLDPSAAINLYKGGLLMPAPTEWYTDPELKAQWTDDPSRPSGYDGAVIDMLMNHSHQTPTGYVVNFSKIMDLVNPALDLVWSGEHTAQEAMDSIAADAQALVQGRRDIDQ